MCVLMGLMTTPLQYGDPPQLGPCVLQARLRTEAAGIVYLGQLPDGRAVSVAVLNQGASLDAAARDRFVGAITDAVQARSGVRGWVTPLIGMVGIGRGRTALGSPPIVAMNGGEAPWVAVPYLPGGPGAEWFLDPVMVSGTLIGERHGPDFVPHWLGDRRPALPAPPAPKPPPTATRRSVVLASTLLATLVLLLMVIVWLLLLRGDEEPQPARPLPPTVFVPTPPPVPPSPQQEPSPSPSQGSPGGRTPLPEGGEDQGESI
jgi:hypothetical protein